MKDNNAFNEMMVHVPLCTHKEASKVLVIGSTSEDLKAQTAKMIQMQVNLFQKMKNN